jgi:molybdopterin-guanine dinucleotide biosynthesis protein A
MTIAGIVLCGGASRRMGRSKAWLDFKGEALLRRVVRIVSQAVPTVIVVAGPDQRIPELPSEIVIARDTVEYQGPLVGLSAGFSVAPTRISHVFCTGCDTPFLTSKLIEFMLTHVQIGQAVVPLIGGQRQSLPAVYPTTIANKVQAQLTAGIRSLRSLWNIVPIIELNETDIRKVDPTLAAFQSMNEPEEYAAALKS